jgi:hypothetical protein
LKGFLMVQIGASNLIVLIWFSQFKLLFLKRL